MKSHVSLAVAVLVMSSPAAAQSAPGAGHPVSTTEAEPEREDPRGTSDQTGGTQRFDEVGHAMIGGGEGATARVAGLSAGDFAEVTAIDTGRTIVIAVTGADVETGQLAVLTGGAAAKLDVGGERFAVRVRRVVPAGAELAALRAGVAAERSEAPPVLLTALRRKLGVPVATPAAPKLAAAPRVATPPKPAPPRPKPSTPARAASTSGYYVQVAALANASRAADLAKRLGGVTASTRGVTRVQLGPFPDQATAARKRAAVARMGYPGALIVRITP